MSLSFLLTSLIVVVSPGTGVLYTLATALSRGSRASIAAAFGCTLGILPAMLAAMLGLRGRVDVLEGGRLTPEPGPVVDDLAVDLTGSVVDEGHPAFLFIGDGLPARSGSSPK